MREGDEIVEKGECIVPVSPGLKSKEGKLTPSSQTTTKFSPGGNPKWTNFCQGLANFQPFLKPKMSNGVRHFRHSLDIFRHFGRIV